MTRTISSRENDRNGFKIIVPLKERGKPVDLTGYVVKYEAISPYGNFVRDDAVVTNARDGIFEYIVSKEAVSSAGVWIGYFAFEKGTERFTTQDIRISLGNDVKQGSIQIENYIAEFDKLKKQIDALQIAVDKANVVKRSGDTMVGNLIMDAIVGGESRVLFQTGPTGTDQVGIRHVVSNNTTAFRDYRSGLSVWEWNGTIFNVNANTNLLKKTGDTMTGDLTIKKDGVSLNFSTVGGSRNARIFYNANEASDSGLNIQTPNGKLLLRDGSNITREVATKEKDTDWTNLTLINGVTNQTGKTSKVKRTGDTVCLTVNVIGVKNNQIITTLPTAFRPLSDMGFSSSYIKSDLNSAEGIITIRADGSVHCEWITEGSTPLKFWSFTLTYLI
ncbi:BppU family phage baseplate upper protein [Bacillus cereus]|uniref:BppU family phage baseplate upper protein n=1 Tax=Bacillus cereus TaxID=1396 RepID=UPI003EDF6B80